MRSSLSLQQSRRRGEVGIAALAIILAVLIGGLIAATYATTRFGWLGVVVGGPVGGIVTFAILMLCLYVWEIVKALLFGGVPYLPPCIDGKCCSGLLTEFGDYEPEFNDEQRAYFRCKCGRLYWRNRKEGRVLEVMADGTTEPYMIWRSFRGWRPESIMLVLTMGNPFIQIRSSLFPIIPGEEEELVNDGMYGKALANYLQEHLIGRGYDSPFVCCEDWGWWVDIKGHPFTMGLCVYGVLLDDKSLDLCVQATPEPERRWSWTKFRVIDRAPAVEKLNRDLKDILESDSEISVLGYSDEFPLGDE